MTPEWTEAHEREHAAIVDQLRRAGWDRINANEEADRLMAERIERRGPGRPPKLPTDEAADRIAALQARICALEAQIADMNAREYRTQEKRLERAIAILRGET